MSLTFSWFTNQQKTVTKTGIIGAEVNNPPFLIFF
nr:MAG TPA: hypothetical protein [Caudoviricetes sp.]DAP90944.1 MAG TPA: hypothetical protein [Caudoviricetes sp.]DAZ18827.1 MAG TPA: hypothetical protein [Caudoviricetes sp.]